MFLNKCEICIMSFVFCMVSFTLLLHWKSMCDAYKSKKSMNFLHCFFSRNYLKEEHH